VESQISEKEYEGLIDSDPLRALQWSNSLEGKLLFRSWGALTDGSTTKTVGERLFLQAFEGQKEALASSSSSSSAFEHSHHDPPAPQGLSTYREISRRWPCHLYGYATVPKSGLSEIGHYASQILEVGAGTGYLTALLRRQGLDVVAIDLAVSSKPNEYHGAVPSWTDVVESDVGPSEMKGACPDLDQRALMICYPPPDSRMAYRSLRAWGGEFFIHVGEFVGVTGTRRFEEGKFALKVAVQVCSLHYLLFIV
jgi:hypothetical protein